MRNLGSGGFADVFLYQQGLPSRPVAVKVLKNLDGHPVSARALAREANVLSAVSRHPSVVEIFSVGIAPDGRAYIVMEYCPGSYRERIKGGRIPLHEALETGIKIGSALETLHRSGFLHRDVKPANVLLNAYGEPVLSDFGIAISNRAGNDVLAMSVAWSAPEVVAEKSAGTVRSEVWSFGALLYGFLSGRSPFDRGGAGVEELKKRILRGGYSPVRRDDVPLRLQAVLEKALQRRPADRFGTVAETVTQLQLVQRELGLQVTPLLADGSRFRASA